MALTKKEEDIEKQFTEIIREKMTGEEFWNWVNEWQNAEDLIDQAEEWEIGLKQETIADYKKGKYR